MESSGSPWEWKGNGSRILGKSNWELERDSFRQRAHAEGDGRQSAVALAMIYDEPADEGEATMVVQLQTFRPPTPPLPSPSIPMPDTATPSNESASPLVVSPPRVISNQRHLLCLALEIEMMRAGKIVSPLRQRSVVIRAGTIGTERRGSGLTKEYV